MLTEHSLEVKSNGWLQVLRGRFKSLRVIKVCVLLVLIIAFAATSIQGQKRIMVGLFENRNLELNGKPQTRLTVNVQLQGKTVTGDYSVDEIVGGIR